MNNKTLAYIVKRILLAILSLFIVIAITFFTMHAIPASPFSSEKAKSDAVIAALEAKYGFDKPVTVQFWNYLKGIVKFDFEVLSFNTAISQMMIFINEIYRVGKVSKEYAEGFIKLFNPVCPHVSEEMWEIFGHTNTIAFEPWPTYDEEKTKANEITIVVQVNGKVRDKISVPATASKEEIEKVALSSDKVKNYLTAPAKKVIVVPGKLVSIVC